MKCVRCAADMKCYRGFNLPEESWEYYCECKKSAESEDRAEVDLSHGWDLNADGFYDGSWCYRDLVNWITPTRSEPDDDPVVSSATKASSLKLHRPQWKGQVHNYVTDALQRIFPRQDLDALAQQRYPLLETCPPASSDMTIRYTLAPKKKT